MAAHKKLIVKNICVKGTMASPNPHSRQICKHGVRLLRCAMDYILWVSVQ
jgi:hypothetical protein